MREQFALAEVFEPKGAKAFFVRNSQVHEEPSYQEPVKVGEIKLHDSSVIHQFGIQALVHHDDEVIALIENPGRTLFVKQEEGEESSAIKKSGHANVMIGPSGIRIIDTKTRRQMLIRLTESDLVGAEITPPLVTLSASVALVEPRSQHRFSPDATKRAPGDKSEWTERPY